MQTTGIIHESDTKQIETLQCHGCGRAFEVQHVWTSYSFRAGDSMSRLMKLGDTGYGGLR